MDGFDEESNEKVIMDCDNCSNFVQTIGFGFLVFASLMLVVTYIGCCILQNGYCYSQRDDPEESSPDNNDKDNDKLRPKEREAMLVANFERKGLEMKITSEELTKIGQDMTAGDTERDDEDDDLEAGDNVAVAVAVDDSGDEEISNRMGNISNGCAICLESYKLDDVLVRSDNKNCPHFFHRNCLVRYFVKVMGTNHKNLRADKPPCPCCRQTFCNVTTFSSSSSSSTSTSQSKKQTRSSTSDGSRVMWGPSNNSIFRSVPVSPDAAMLLGL